MEASTIFVLGMICLMSLGCILYSIIRDYNGWA